MTSPSETPPRPWRRSDRIAFGGDYNPEQWPDEVQAEDVELMQRAGVTFVSVGIFSWAKLEPREDSYEFGWLDRVLDRLADAGIDVDLATPTAGPPAWLARAHPETLPQTAAGVRLWPGSRQAFCPSSPVYRERAVAVAGALAERYRDHPALALWHIHNEYGCHNAHCYCDVSAAAFRTWLQRRYDSLDALNESWGTAFWGQGYGDWAEIGPPRTAPTHVNPGQQLDFARFSSEELLDCFRAERDAVRAHTPEVPVTTNFMAVHFKHLDYWRWAAEVDVVSNDHYLLADPSYGLPRPEVNLALSADLTRSLAGGRPWLLMEHSSSAVNWQPTNLAKAPGQETRNTVTTVARGADGIGYFQWRASRRGSEKFHSAMLPHAGPDTTVYAEVSRLGGEVLPRLAEVAGSRVAAEVAMVFDYPAWWALELDAHPAELRYLDLVHRLYDPLWDAGVTVDLVPPEADLSAYRLVLVPTLYLVSDADAVHLRRYVEGGGTVAVSYFSGIVDEAENIRLGGYPGAFRDLLGVWVEQFHPLPPGRQVTLDDGSRAEVWTEQLHLRGAEAVLRYADGPLPGVPAVTRHPYGQGTAWYLATRPDPAALAGLLDRVLAEAGVTRPGGEGVEQVRRVGEHAAYRFLVNHGDVDREVPATGTDLLTGTEAAGSVTVPAGGVVVLREPR